MNVKREYSTGYATYLCQAGSVSHFNAAVEELRISPIRFVDDVAYYGAADVLKLQRHFEQEQKNEVTR